MGLEGSAEGFSPPKELVKAHKAGYFLVTKYKYDCSKRLVVSTEINLHIALHFYPSNSETLCWFSNIISNPPSVFPEQSCSASPPAVPVIMFGTHCGALLAGRVKTSGASRNLPADIQQMKV